MSRKPRTGRGSYGNDYDSDKFVPLYIVLSKQKVETDLALCFHTEEGKTIWLPRSQITVFDTKDKMIKKVKIPTWLAEEKGIERQAEKNPDPIEETQEW